MLKSGLSISGATSVALQAPWRFFLALILPLPYFYAQQSARSLDSPSSEPPTDQVSLRFTKFETEYTPVKPDGSLGVPIKEGWDLAMNRAV